MRKSWFIYHCPIFGHYLGCLQWFAVVDNIYMNILVAKSFHKFLITSLGQMFGRRITDSVNVLMLIYIVTLPTK